MSITFDHVATIAELENIRQTLEYAISNVTERRQAYKRYIQKLEELEPSPLRFRILMRKIMNILKEVRIKRYLQEKGFLTLEMQDAEMLEEETKDVSELVLVDHTIGKVMRKAVCMVYHIPYKCYGRVAHTRDDIYSVAVVSHVCASWNSLAYKIPLSS